MNRTPYLAFALAAGLLVGTVTQARAAEPITFKICGDASPTLYFRQPAGTQRLEVRCSKTGPVVFTIQGCVGPGVKRDPSTGFYTVTCREWLPPK